VKLFHALFVHEHSECRTIFWEVWQNILDISCATHIEATVSHALAWAQRWFKFSEVVPTTCNLSLHSFSFLILLHQSCKMCNIVYFFICSICRTSMSLMTWDNYHLVRSRHWNIAAMISMDTFSDGKIRSESSTCSHNKWQISNKCRRCYRPRYRLLRHYSKYCWVHVLWC
jgi:hypothetical protein